MCVSKNEEKQNLKRVLGLEKLKKILSVSEVLFVLRVWGGL